MVFYPHDRHRKGKKALKPQQDQTEIEEELEKHQERIYGQHGECARSGKLSDRV